MSLLRSMMKRIAAVESNLYMNYHELPPILPCMRAIVERPFFKIEPRILRMDTNYSLFCLFLEREGHGGTKSFGSPFDI